MQDTMDTQIEETRALITGYPTSKMSLHLLLFLAVSLYLLLLRSSIFLALLAARLALSSFSCSARQRWKFSTTTPTNMLRTKKPTRRRNEMKYTKRHSLKFSRGWKQETASRKVQTEIPSGKVPVCQGQRRPVPGTLCWPNRPWTTERTET